jgi:hypothetical protein
VQGRRPDEVERGVDTVRIEVADGRRYLAGVEQGMVDTALRQEGEAVGPPGGGQHHHPIPLSRDHPDGRAGPPQREVAV